MGGEKMRADAAADSDIGVLPQLQVGGKRASMDALCSETDVHDKLHAMRRCYAAAWRDSAGVRHSRKEGMYPHGTVSESPKKKAWRDSKAERLWSLPSECPPSWGAEEFSPQSPSSDECFAALLHGEQPEYLVYACVLGNRLRDSSPNPDRVLILGPGRLSESSRVRNCLRACGWDRLVPVEPIVAPHRDKSRSKRHALVFTKLRALELPYERVLLLDLDLLPRKGIDLSALFAVPAPAAKYHNARYNGKLPAHGEEIPDWLREDWSWSPNAGVMRLDPRPTRREREEEVSGMIHDVMREGTASYLPEQYYLAERLPRWRNLDLHWNWEVYFEWDTPHQLYPLEQAVYDSWSQGWSRYYRGCEKGVPCAATVLAEVRVWHFSGTRDTQPWGFLDLADAEAVKDFAAEVWFKFRDPSGLMATAMSEWREALDALLRSECDALGVVADAVQQLVVQAEEVRCGGSWGWPCDACGEVRCNLQEVWGAPANEHEAWEATGHSCDDPFRGMRWLCAECIVAGLQRSASNYWPMY
mmetsp:Transcript_88189/g.248149  ORF Transcript_88189/g.248149 Transcript_88189/m.248149 type:complete len:529 (-) Transcript_88189:94-1680(-)